MIINLATQEETAICTDVYIHKLNNLYYFSNYADAKREKFEVLGQAFITLTGRFMAFRGDGFTVKFYFDEKE